MLFLSFRLVLSASPGWLPGSLRHLPELCAVAEVRFSQLYTFRVLLPSLEPKQPLIHFMQPFDALGQLASWYMLPCSAYSFLCPRWSWTWSSCRHACISSSVTFFCLPVIFAVTLLLLSQSNAAQYADPLSVFWSSIQNCLILHQFPLRLLLHCYREYQCLFYLAKSSLSAQVTVVCSCTPLRPANS